MSDVKPSQKTTHLPGIFNPKNISHYVIPAAAVPYKMPPGCTTRTSRMSRQKRSKDEANISLSKPPTAWQG